MQHERIVAQALYRHDPVLVLLKDHWRLADRWILLSSAILPTIIFFLWETWALTAPAAQHLWQPNDLISMFLQCLVIFPLLFLIYLRLPHWFADLFNKLHSDDIIGVPRPGSHGLASYARFVELVTTWTDKWWWVAGALGLNAVYLSYRLPFVEIPSTLSTPLWLRCLDLMIYIPLMYATFLSIARILAAFVALNGLLVMFTIRVRPLHVDGSGGLGVLGQIIWVSVILLIWDALLLYSGVMSRNLSLFSPFEMSLLGVIYIILVPCVLVGWLLLPHLVMVKAREEALRPLAHELSEIKIETSFISSKGQAQALDTSKVSTERLIELKQRYDFIRNSFPTWPVHLRTISRIVIALILPALLPIIIDHLPQFFSWLSQPWLH